MRKYSSCLLHISWEALHTGPWHTVAVAWREIHSLAAIARTIQTLRDKSSIHCSRKAAGKSQLQMCVRDLDVALLVGGPGMARLIHPLIDRIHTDIAEPSATDEAPSCSAFFSLMSAGSTSDGPPTVCFQQSSQEHKCKTLQQQYLMRYGQRCTWLEERQAPGMMQFEEAYMSKQQPVLLQGMADAWPAMHRCAQSFHIVRSAADHV